MTRWTLDDIPWDRFDREAVEPEIVCLVKAAALVEFNGDDYESYLSGVFHDDPGFQREIRAWAAEEVRHGEALARWAKLADRDFDFASAVERFRGGYRLDVKAGASIRGSRAGELVARCVVETGTSSYYTALGETAREPVLKEICRRIAADEFRHYKLFYSQLERNLARDRLGRLARLRVVLGRFFEAGDDELAYAYFAANHPGEHYERRRFSRAYARRAYPLYRLGHVQRGLAMALKAGGIRPVDAIMIPLSRLALWFLRRQARILSAERA
jgi:hypothetical protein